MDLQQDGVKEAMHNVMRGVSLEFVSYGVEELAHGISPTTALESARAALSVAKVHAEKYGPIVMVMGLCKDYIQLQQGASLEIHWAVIEDPGTCGTAFASSGGIRRDWTECAAKSMARSKSIGACVEVVWLDLFHTA